MNKREFEKVMRGVRELGAHLRGERVKGILEIDVPDVKAIRETAKVSQSEFAALIGVNLRTLQNWEQQRTRPAGPARALLRIVAANPGAAIEALHSA